MKSKEEILEQHGIMNDGMHIHSNLGMLFPTIIRSMDIYAAQEVERVKSETCVWGLSDALMEYEYPDGGSTWNPGCNQGEGIVGYVYCPYCGRKIERV